MGLTISERRSRASRIHSVVDDCCDLSLLPVIRDDPLGSFFDEVERIRKLRAKGYTTRNEYCADERDYKTGDETSNI
jgi:hypothetical protein